MTTCILTPGLSSARSHGEPRAVAVETGAAALLDAVGSALDAAAAVLVVVPTWSQAAVRDFRVVAATLSTPRLAAVSLAAPPLALAVLADQLAWLGAQLSEPGVVHGCAPALVRALLGAAWTSDVSKLAEPAPRLGQHLRSLLPGAAFLVGVLPSRLVVVADEEAAAAAGWDQQVAQVVLSGPDPGRAWLRAQVTEHLRAQVVIELPPSALTQTFYRSDKACEVAGSIADLRLLAAQAAAAAAPRCAWCGQVRVTPACAFCGALAQRDLAVALG